MGTSRYARCEDCGHADFAVMQGGGFAFFLLRCDRCGQTKSVSRHAEPAPRASWLKRLFQRNTATSDTPQAAFSVGDAVLRLS